ncbi:hypothetical protein BKA69DRAFT_1043123 [Paraphysoderma sedebokerense]|nr:hypothetical protein BKA69DRAFT_1043123 [Paraphysoderma sedebokerense]
MTSLGVAFPFPGPALPKAANSVDSIPLNVLSNLAPVRTRLLGILQASLSENLRPSAKHNQHSTMSEIDSDDYDIVSTPELSEDEAEKEVDKASSLTERLVSSSNISASLVTPSFSVFERFHSSNDRGKEFLSRSANLRYTSLPSSEADDIMNDEIHTATNLEKDDDSSSLVQSELELPPQRPNTPSSNLLGVEEGGKADEILNRMIQSLDDYSQESLNMEPTYSTVLEGGSGEVKNLETDLNESGRAGTELTNAVSNEVPSIPIEFTEIEEDVKGPLCSPRRIWFLPGDNYRFYNLVSFVQLVLAFLIVASATTFLYQYSKPFILTRYNDRSTSVSSKPPTSLIVVTPPSVASVVSAKLKTKHRVTKGPKSFNTVGLNRDGGVKLGSSVQVVASPTEVDDLLISETSIDSQPASIDQHVAGVKSTNTTSKPESSRLLISDAESDPFINNLISVINFTSKLVSSTSTSVQAIISSLPSQSASNMAHLHMQILNQSSVFIDLIIQQCESFTILLNETIERFHQFANGTMANVKSTSDSAFSFMESMLNDVKDATKIIQSKVSEAADMLSESVVKSGRSVKTTVTATTENVIAQVSVSSNLVRDEVSARVQALKNGVENVAGSTAGTIRQLLKSDNSRGDEDSHSTPAESWHPDKGSQSPYCTMYEDSYYVCKTESPVSEDRMDEDFAKGDEHVLEHEHVHEFEHGDQNEPTTDSDFNYFDRTFEDTIEKTKSKLKKIKQKVLSLLPSQYASWNLWDSNQAVTYRCSGDEDDFDSEMKDRSKTSRDKRRRRKGKRNKNRSDGKRPEKGTGHDKSRIKKVKDWAKGKLRRLKGRWINVW